MKGKEPVVLEDYSIVEEKTDRCVLKKYKAMQLVGDRDKPSVSIHDWAFCVCANPMSDRSQVILIEYANELKG